MLKLSAFYARQKPNRSGESKLSGSCLRAGGFANSVAGIQDNNPAFWTPTEAKRCLFSAGETFLPSTVLVLHGQLDGFSWLVSMGGVWISHLSSSWTVRKVLGLSELSLSLC